MLIQRLSKIRGVLAECAIGPDALVHIGEDRAVLVAIDDIMPTECRGRMGTFEITVRFTPDEETK